MAPMGSEEDLEHVLDEQVTYYRARAAEYDLDMWQPDIDGALAAEVGELERHLAAFRPGGDVCELGCGTGSWTVRLARWADRLTAVDAAPEMIALARAKVRPHPVEFVVADLFSWSPPRPFDVVSFSFVLSHVPPQRFDDFWDLVRRCLRPGGRVCFVDAAPQQASDERPLPAGGTPLVRRRLRDGREYRVVKVFHDAAELERALRERGWQARVRTTARTFLWGSAADRARGW